MYISFNWMGFMRNRFAIHLIGVYLADLPFPTNVIARTEQQRLQSQHKLAQKSWFGVAKDLDSFESIQMHLYCNFSLQQYRIG